MNGLAAYIPDKITVHLGTPKSNAPNITVSFIDYLKNVASSETYPTWPETALRANILVFNSFALNRVFNDYYRKKGYDFDITSTKEFDLIYVPGRNIFFNIANLVNEIFDNYLRRRESAEPLLAEHCNGTTVTCDGLSQWGAVGLADKGYIPYDILRTYYGDDLDIVRNAPVKSELPSFYGKPLTEGESGDDVRTIQIQLNRVSQNYPVIPKINPVNGIFSEATQNSVDKFKEIFNLPPDKAVKKSDWYTLSGVYSEIKKLAVLHDFEKEFENSIKQFSYPLKEGDTGKDIRLIQYYLKLGAFFNPEVPEIEITGYYGPETTSAVKAFQFISTIPQDGVVDSLTWNSLYDLTEGILGVIPPADSEITTADYPGYVLARGSAGDSVFQLQKYLSLISQAFNNVPMPAIDGFFGQSTEAAVSAFQEMRGININGAVNKETWDEITSLYSDLMTGYTPRVGQFPGFTLKEGMIDA